MNILSWCSPKLYCAKHLSRKIPKPFVVKKRKYLRHIFGYIWYKSKLLRPGQNGYQLYFDLIFTLMSWNYVPEGPIDTDLALVVVTDSLASWRRRALTWTTGDLGHWRIDESPGFNDSVIRVPQPLSTKLSGQPSAPLFLHHWTFVRGIHLLLVIPLIKRPVMRKLQPVG